MTNIFCSVFSPLGIMLIISLFNLIKKNNRIGIVCQVIALQIIWICSTPIISNYILESFENRYPQLEAKEYPNADAIILLSGGLYPSGKDSPQINLGGSADRIWYGSQLMLAGKAQIIIVSDGALKTNTNSKSIAEDTSQMLIGYGVAKDKIFHMKPARNTYDEAMLTKEFCQENNIDSLLLVTSAFHMRRAEATFRSAGLNVVPATTDFEIDSNRAISYSDFFPSSNALNKSSRAWREVAAYWYYQLRGRI